MNDFKRSSRDGDLSKSRRRSLPPVNENIQETEFRVISSTGENLGLLSKREALNVAEKEGLDLVLMSKGDSGCIAKIMDYGKHLYEKKKQQSALKKKQKSVEVKEVKLRPSIDIGDYNCKVGRIVDFISHGKHVKITLQFRGRAIGMKRTLGSEMFERITKDLLEKLPGYSIENQKESVGTAIWSRVVAGKKNK